LSSREIYGGSKAWVILKSCEINGGDELVSIMLANFYSNFMGVTFDFTTFTQTFQGYTPFLQVDCIQMV